jgi:LacI family transcriptional regulator
VAGIRDVARKTGLSIATVSRVINGNGYVSVEKRALIQRVAAELNYQPNAGARLMRNGESRMVGVLLPALDIQFFGILAHTIEQELFRRDYRALICSTAESVEHENRYIAAMLAQQVDGIIAASVLADAAPFRKILASKVPIVGIDRALPGQHVATVKVDHMTGGRMMARHLLELGHTRIAIVGAPRHSAPIGERVDGITGELAGKGLAPFAIKLGDTHSFEACRELAATMLGAKSKPTAIIGTTDIAAIGAIHAAVAQGLGVPGNLSVIGFDDLPAGRYVLPQLTTIAQPLRGLGRMAVAKLCRLMMGEGETDEDNEPLELLLIKRGTTAAPN